MFGNYCTALGLKSICLLLNKQQVLSLALKSKFVASYDIITFPQKLYFGESKKAGKESDKRRSNAQESITKYPP